MPLGETLKLKIPINGKGPFTFKVKKDDQSPVDSDRIRVQEHDDYIMVTIPGKVFAFHYSTPTASASLQMSNVAMLASIRST